MINKDNIKKLIRALRSGKYTQNFHQLKRNNCFCVLGVACEISGLGSWVECEGGYLEYVTETDHDAVQLTKEVADYYGFSSTCPYIKGIPLICLNDDSKCSFKEIADELENAFIKS